ncbi:MAG TPA: transposase [Tepidisphaeraceae bacterium]|jgi:hypothetical protein
MKPALAYFITFTTYGTRLHGREEGSVDRQHNAPGTPTLPANPNREAAERRAMRQPPYALDAARRAVVLRTVREVCRHRQWILLAAHVRSDHVHVVVAAPAVTPEKVMADLKAWASRRLREASAEPADRDRWTQHGSTRYCNTPASVEAAITYTLDGQGPRMAAHDGRINDTNNESEA